MGRQAKTQRMIDEAHDILSSFHPITVRQDLGMVKVRQKISDSFRSETGPVAFCRIRSYFSTMAKQGHRLCLVARQIFAGIPLCSLVLLTSTVQGLYSYVLAGIPPRRFSVGFIIRRSNS